MNRDMKVHNLQILGEGCILKWLGSVNQAPRLRTSVTLGRPAIQVGEGGRGTRSISDRKRCLPWPGHLLMHFQKEWYQGGAPRTSVSCPEKPIVQTRRFGTRWRIPGEPILLSGPGKHSGHLWIRLGQCYSPRRRQRSRVFISRWLLLTFWCHDRYLVLSRCAKTSVIFWKHHWLQCAGGIRGPWRWSRQESPNHDPQVTLPTHWSAALLASAKENSRTGHRGGDLRTMVWESRP